MRRRLAAIAVATLAAVLLTGCHDDLKPREDSIDRGIRCVEAGGDWTWSEWSGYHCEFDS